MHSIQEAALTIQQLPYQTMPDASKDILASQQMLLFDKLNE